MVIDEHLELTLLEEEQAPELFDVIDRNREFFASFLPWVPATRHRGDSADFIRRSSQSWADGTLLPLGIIQDGRIVGTVALMNLDSGHSTEIGYWLDEAFTGRGLVTAAVRALMIFGREHLGRHRFVIRCQPTNTPSAAVAQRLGFVLEGRQRDAEYVNGKFHDLEVYSWLATDPLPPARPVARSSAAAEAPADD